MTTFWNEDAEVGEEEWTMKENELKEPDTGNVRAWEDILEKVRILSDDDLDDL